MPKRSAVHRLIRSGGCLCLILAMSLSACSQIPVAHATLPAVTPVMQSTSGSPASDRVTVYFTDPHSPTAKSFQGGPDEALAAAISDAQTSVDMAINDLNLPSVTNALITAHKNGIRVRLVTDGDNLDEPQVQDLKDAGISVLDEQSAGLMDDKFAVIDNLEVWTGSMNFTTSDGYLNNNDLLCIRSANLAQDYTAEFEQMVLKGRFGPDKKDPPPYPDLQVGDTPIEVYFAPTDHTASHLEALIRSARQSIYFLAFSFTNDTLADVLLQKASAGIKVAGVMEASQVEPNSSGVFGRLQKAGLDVRLDGNLRNMHHKVLIIDGQVVVTGSYNFGLSDEQDNDENTLVIHSPQLADLYKTEFDRMVAEAKK